MTLQQPCDSLYKAMYLNDEGSKLDSKQPVDNLQLKLERVFLLLALAGFLPFCCLPLLLSSLIGHHVREVLQRKPSI